MPPRFNELILEILHADASRPTIDTLRRLSPSDWQTMIDEAIHFRLAYQTHQFLTADPERLALVPETARHRLSESIRSTLMHNLRQQRQLQNMLMACEAAGLPVILVKGLWLTHIVYGDIKARASGDIDLLVHPQDMPRMLGTLRELGFKPTVDETTLDNLMTHEHELTLNHPDDNACFDIHWSLTIPFEETPVDETQLWQRAETFDLAGLPCLSLSLEDHLLYLCFHTALHHRFLYVGPRALLDVAQLIACPPRAIDWHALTIRAREMGWQRGVWLTLAIVGDYFGVQAPATVLDELKPLDADETPIKSAALDAVFLGQDIHDSLTPNIVRLFDEPSWRQRTAILSRKLFPPVESIASLFQVDVNEISIFRLYLKHWQRLLNDHFFKMIRLSRGNPNHTLEWQRARLIKQWLDS